VGAVLVQNGQIIGEGFHRGPGTGHAEACALDDAVAKGHTPRGATLYVTLEPCCHSGPGKRTPPCAQRLIVEGIKEVWAACPDPNPLVSGRGRELLLQAGIAFHWGPLEDQAHELISDFAAWIGPRRPFITLKWAQSLNAIVSRKPTESPWITGPSARTEAHRLRAMHDTIAVGAGTVRRDNPTLSVRGVDAPGGQPRRLIFAGTQLLAPSARVFADDPDGLTWVVAAPQSPAGRQASSLVGNRIVAWDGVDLAELGHSLLGAGFYRILVEGGPALLSTFLRGSFWDRTAVFVAPKFLEPYGDSPLAVEQDWVNPQWTTCSPDTLLTAWNPQSPSFLSQMKNQEAVCSPA